MIAAIRSISAKVNAPRFRPGWIDKKTGKAMLGFWYVFHGSKQINLSKYGAPRLEKAKREAREAWLQWRKEIEGEEAAKIVKANRAVTVYDVCQHYIVNHLRPVCGVGSINTKQSERLLTYLCEGEPEKKSSRAYKGWKNLPAAQLTPRIVKEWFSFHSGWGDSSKYDALCTVKAALSFACKKNDDGETMLAENPLDTMQVGRGGVCEEIFSPEEEKQFRAVAAEKDPAMLEFFAATIELICRPGELAALKLEHFNGSEFVLGAGEWKNGRKTGRCRYIGLSKKWIEWAKARAETMQPGEHFFKTGRGRKWTGNQWGLHFAKVAKKSGLPENYSLYVARHTAITRALKNGANPQDVANQAGTSIVMIQKVYSKLYKEPTSRQNALAALAG